MRYIKARHNGTCRRSKGRFYQGEWIVHHNGGWCRPTPLEAAEIARLEKAKAEQNAKINDYFRDLFNR